MVPVWQPVALPAGDVERERLEARAAELGLMTLRWPERWPPDTHVALLAGVFAQSAGRAVAYSLAAFRQAFAAGRDLSVTDNVLIAAAACELHPRALLKGMESRSVALRLAEAQADADAAGVHRSPTLRVGDRLWEGEEQLEAAREELMHSG